MMSYLREELLPLLKALKDVGGYIVIPDDEGEEFILGQRELDSSFGRSDVLEVSDDYTDEKYDADEEDEVVDLVNRDIALSQEDSEIGDDAIDDSALYSLDDLADGEHSHLDTPPPPPPLRVRFEPIGGDISPDLQE